MASTIVLINATKVSHVGQQPRSNPVEQTFLSKYREKIIIAQKNLSQNVYQNREEITRSELTD